MQDQDKPDFKPVVDFYNAHAKPLHLSDCVGDGKMQDCPACQAMREERIRATHKAHINRSTAAQEWGGRDYP